MVVVNAATQFTEKPRTTSSAATKAAQTSQIHLRLQTSRAMASAGCGFQGVMLSPWSGRM
jgi:hypothetical protein